MSRPVTIRMNVETIFIDASATPADMRENDPIISKDAAQVQQNLQLAALYLKENVATAETKQLRS